MISKGHTPVMALCSPDTAKCNGQEKAELCGGCNGREDHAGSAEGFPGHVRVSLQALTPLQLSSAFHCHKEVTPQVALALLVSAQLWQTWCFGTPDEQKDCLQRTLS